VLGNLLQGSINEARRTSCGEVWCPEWCNLTVHEGVFYPEARHPTSKGLLKGVKGWLRLWVGPSSAWWKWQNLNQCLFAHLCLVSSVEEKQFRQRFIRHSNGIWGSMSHLGIGISDPWRSICGSGLCFLGYDGLAQQAISVAWRVRDMS
jgi:hypothetical protein